MRYPLQPQLPRGLCHHLHLTETSLPGLRVELTKRPPPTLLRTYLLSFPEAVPFLVSLFLLCKNPFFPSEFYSGFEDVHTLFVDFCHFHPQGGNITRHLTKAV